MAAAKKTGTPAKVEPEEVELNTPEAVALYEKQQAFLDNQK